MILLRDLFDELVEIGRSHGQGVEFLRPPRPPKEVREVLIENYGEAPDWLCEWFSWHNGSDLSARYSPGSFRPELWAFGIDFLASLENVATHHEYHRNYPQYLQASRAVFLLRSAYPGEHVAVDLDLENCCFGVAGRYTSILAPSFVDLLSVWVRMVRISTPSSPYGFPEFIGGRYGDDPSRNSSGVMSLPYWDHLGRIARRANVCDEIYPGPYEVSKDYPLEDLRLIDFELLRRNFDRAFVAGFNSI
jgi:hypothetical protein